MSMLIAPSRFGASATLWTPANLTTAPALWLNDTSDLSFVGGTAVATWGEPTGLGMSALTGTATPNAIAAGQNGLRTLRFDGSNDALIGTADVKSIIRNIGAATLFIIGSPAKNTTSTFRRVFDFTLHSSGSARATISVENGVVEATQRRADDDPAANATLTQPDSGWHLYSSEHDWIGQTVGIRMDGGTATTTSTGQGSGNVADSDSDEVGLFGSGLSSGQCAAGDCGEIIVLQYTPTTTERQKIEGYLEWKWGTQANLPAGHPYASAAPTT